MRFHRVTLSEGQVELAKVALHELSLQLKMTATRQRCKEAIAALVEGQTRVIDSPTPLMEAGLALVSKA